MKKHLKEMAADFNSLDNDKDRFRFILKHKGLFVLMLDNDQTSPIFNEAALTPHFDDEEIEHMRDDIRLNDFDSYLGESNGVIDLLAAVGIKGEGV